MRGSGSKPAVIERDNDKSAAVIQNGDRTGAVAERDNGTSTAVFDDADDRITATAYEYGTNDITVAIK